MMKILMIEDDLTKEKDVCGFLKQTFRDVVIQVARSYHSGFVMVAKSNFDFMIVDMTLPKYDGEKAGAEGTLHNGGEVLISNVLDLGIAIKSLVLTQYETFKDETLETINQRLLQDCQESYIGYVKYDSTSDSWKNNLIEKINNAIYSHN